VTRDLSDRQLAVIHSPSRSQSHLQQASITGLCVCTRFGEKPTGKPGNCDDCI